MAEEQEPEEVLADSWKQEVAELWEQCLSLRRLQSGRGILEEVQELRNGVVVLRQTVECLKDVIRGDR